MERCIKVLTTDDLAWNDYIGQLPFYMQDVYFTRRYHLLEEKKSDGKAYLFVYTEMGTEIGLYAFIKRPIDQMSIQGKFFDIETVYGYGGPLVNTENEELLERSTLKCSVCSLQSLENKSGSSILLFIF